jgi:hypothetical protein
MTKETPGSGAGTVRGTSRTATVVTVIRAGSAFGGANRRCCGANHVGDLTNQVAPYTAWSRPSPARALRPGARMIRSSAWSHAPRRVAPAIGSDGHPSRRERGLNGDSGQRPRRASSIRLNN